MKNQIDIGNLRFFFILLSSFLISSCSVFCPGSNTGHDPQFIQIFYHSGSFNELDTFHGTYQKDLIPGTVKTTMWLTTREQEILLTKIENAGFFSFPDTIHKSPNVIQQPDHGAQILRIKYKDQDKTVVWYYPIDTKAEYKFFKYYIEGIKQLLYDIIVSKPEYKALPPVKGGYQ